jgi:uncharacterized 2Fe-2S/4Fe-4S cluster protein (DUF4445 family)
MGAILSEKPHEADEMTLIVDIGTNGEVVLGNRDELWVTSCATGPALEGAHISCGMRAAPGAVHRVQIDQKTHKVSLEVLGDSDGARARGICGSGIIDAAASMLKSGLMLPNGRIKDNMPGVITDAQGVGRQFVLVPSEESATGREISLSLKDVRQIQLAKAALSVGIRFLMKRSGVERIGRMVLTGAFGARFDWRNAVVIGMLPEQAVCSDVRIVENAAGVGAIESLLDKKKREEANDLAGRIRFLELAREPDFAVEFPMATIFPSPSG